MILGYPRLGYKEVIHKQIHQKRSVSSMNPLANAVLLMGRKHTVF